MSARWLPELSPQPASTRRVFCFPHAGGGAAVYRPWRGASPRLEIVPLELPGRERRWRESPIADLAELARQAADALAPHLGEPYLLLGHSFGGWTAWEVARELRRRGAPAPELLVVSAARAPQIACDPDDLLHLLPDEELLGQLQERYGGVPAEIADHPELRQLFLPAIRADITALETFDYHEEPPLPCPLLACGGADDRAITAADLMAWKTQTAGRFSFRRFPGGHFYLQQAWPELLRAAEGMLGAPHS